MLHKEGFTIASCIISTNESEDNSVDECTWLIPCKGGVMENLLLLSSVLMSDEAMVIAFTNSPTIGLPSRTNELLKLPLHKGGGIVLSLSRF